MSKEEAVLKVKNNLLGISALIVQVKDYGKMERHIAENEEAYTSEDMHSRDYIRISRVLKRARKDLESIEEDITKNRPENLTPTS